MIEDIERLERRSLARALKILLDILFYLTLALAALAAIWKEAVRMAEDQALTV